MPSNIQRCMCMWLVSQGCTITCLLPNRYLFLHHCFSASFAGMSLQRRRHAILLWASMLRKSTRFQVRCLWRPVQCPELPGNPRQELTRRRLGDKGGPRATKAPAQKAQDNHPAASLSCQREHRRQNLHCGYARGPVRGFEHLRQTTGFCGATPQPSGIDGSVSTDWYSLIVSLFHCRPFHNEKKN